MKTTLAALAVSLALAAIGAAPATAADMNGNGPGSLKDRGPSGTPVPAPMPYEETYKYYVGMGIGWSFKASGDIGLNAGGAGNLPYGDAGDFKHPFGGSLYAGRYITPSVRAELGWDFRNQQHRAKTLSYNAQLTSKQDFGAPVGVQPVTNTYAMTRDEDVGVKSQNAMLNFYYDMNRGGRFNPYVGAGIGLSYMQLSRASNEAISGCTGSAPPVGIAPATPQPCWTGAAPGSPGLPNGIASTSYTSAQAGWGLAAALMAGLTYNLSERTHLDMGYRMIYQGAKASTSASSLGYCSGCGNAFTGLSKLTADPRFDHELRAGIRWDLW